jgi:hypothetical protein
MNQLIFQGSIVGREQLTNFEFNPSYFFSGCCICGRVYQTATDRDPPSIDSPDFGAFEYEQKVRHNWWREKENKRHTEKQHRELLTSGNFCTPEAAQLLAPLGLFSLTDLVVSSETSAALREAKRAPSDDAESE